MASTASRPPGRKPLGAALADAWAADTVPRAYLPAARAAAARPPWRSRRREGAVGAHHREPPAWPPGRGSAPSARRFGKASSRRRRRSAGASDSCEKSTTPLAPDCAREGDLLDDARDVEPVRGDPGPDGLGEPARARAPLDLLLEDPVVGGVGHRAQGRQDAAREPARPVLELLADRLRLVRSHRRREHEPGPLPARRVREARRQGGEDLPPVAVPGRRAARGAAQEVRPPVHAPEPLERRARVVEARARVADEVEVEPVHRVGPDELTNDAFEVVPHRRDGRREVVALDVSLGPAGLHDQLQPPRAGGHEGRRRRRLRDHRPLGVLQEDVPAGEGLAEVRGQQDVHPGVDLQALGPGPGQQPGERVEVARLPLEQRAAGGEGRAVEGVATPAHLHEERVHSRRGGVVHRLVDRLRRDERGAHHPEAPQLRGRGRGGRRQGRTEQAESQGSARERHPHPANATSRRVGRQAELPAAQQFAL